jgi:hypothetical protein
MDISQLMKIVHNPAVVKTCRENANHTLDQLIKEHYRLKNAFSPINILPKDNHKSLIKLWLIYKNSKKPQGWQMSYWSYDYPHERELFQNKDMIQERLANEDSMFVKNFYGVNKPLTGFKKLYDFAMTQYRKNRLLQMHFYLNNYFELQESGKMMPRLLFQWSIAKSNRQDDDNVVQM